MNIQLLKWNENFKQDLILLCNSIDKKYLSNRMPFPYTEKDADWWLNFVKENDGINGIYRAIIADGRCVGNISVEKKSDVNCKDSEIGYTLLPTETSKGIVTEAVKQMCKIAFKELDIIRITANVFSPNEASKKVLMKNEFSLEGIKKNAIYKNEEIYDLLIYGLYK